MTSDSNLNTSPSSGRLFALLTACLYLLFTLLPDSHSLMVQWSWVFIWQIALLCPIIWLLVMVVQTKQIKGLGFGLDWVVGLIIMGIIISTLFAQFPNQARWYGWAALGFIAAIYALNYWVYSPQKRNQLLTFQGYVNLAFIGLSLILWTTQTFLPELSKLNQFKQVGVNLSFDFSAIELRNWAPIGHQNYVAGYLLLALPLLVALAIQNSGKQRWLWVTGIGLGLLAMYTTSSRGGWLGLLVLFLFGLLILLIRQKTSLLWLGLGGIGGLFVIIFLALANNRLRTLILAIFQGQSSGELLYRLINTSIGWNMGISHPFTGIGLGGVPILYQKYRPFWAGRESEIVYQLHSTPVQLWAEIGIWGILPVLVGIILLTYYFVRWLFNNQLSNNSEDSIFLICLYGGLLGYSIMSLTDYQLDNISISGTLVIYLVCLTSILKELSKNTVYFTFPSFLTYGSLGILVAVIIWLFPIHRAWQLSSQGFAFLRQEKLESFEKYLGRSHELAPWEPYYPYQLGWNLGNIAIKTPDPQVRQSLINKSIDWFQKAIEVSPYREFGYTNLGWLLLPNNPVAATEAFANSSQLVPAKRGVMYGLGLSLLAHNKTDLAIEAFSLEGLRDPLFITSPIWRSPGLNSIYPQVLGQIITRYNQLLEKASQPEDFKKLLHQSRGGVYWWRGDFKNAQKDLEKYGSKLSKNLLNISQNKSSPDSFSSPISLVIEAWNNPSQRPSLLQKAWLLETKTPLSTEIEQQLLAAMNTSNSFDQWLKQNAPSIQYRRQRSGFGVVSRHIDGSIPLDLWVVVENIPMNTWFNNMLPSPRQNRELELALQPWRDDLLQQIEILK